jgi:AcrR family transcriptional regulator
MSSGGGESHRADLLDAIERIMLDEGFAHLRVGMLASRLHCSRSTLYSLAPSKQELFRIVFERWISRALDDARSKADEEATLADRIVRFTEMVGVWQAKASPALWRDLRGAPEVADIISVSRGRGKAIVKEYLDEGVAEGIFRQVNTAFVAHIVWVAAASTRDPDLLVELGISVDDAVAEIGRLIALGIQAEPAPSHGARS